MQSNAMGGAALFLRRELLSASTVGVGNISPYHFDALRLLPHFLLKPFKGIPCWPNFDTPQQALYPPV